MRNRGDVPVSVSALPKPRGIDAAVDEAGLTREERVIRAGKATLDAVHRLAPSRVDMALTKAGNAATAGPLARLTNRPNGLGVRMAEVCTLAAHAAMKPHPVHPGDKL